MKGPKKAESHDALPNIQALFPSSSRLVQATWEEYRNIIRVCRDAMRKAKVSLESNVVRDVKNNKKGFFKYVSSKGKARENVVPLLDEVGTLLTNTAKTELLNAFFDSFLHS